MQPTQPRLPMKENPVTDQQNTSENAALLARLRYRRAPQAARILWTLSLHQVDDVLRGACREVVTRVQEATGLPVFTGAAPKAR